MGWRRNISKRILCVLMASMLVLSGTDFTVLAVEDQAGTEAVVAEISEEGTATEEEKSESDVSEDGTLGQGETDGEAGGDKAQSGENVSRETENVENESGEETDIEEGEEESIEETVSENTAVTIEELVGDAETARQGERAVKASGKIGDNLTWTLNDSGILMISGTGSMESSLMSCPWADYRSSITIIVIEEGVTNVGDYSFSRCSEVTSVSIPTSVTYIGGNAFSGCTRLTNIIIPNSVTSIGSFAFEDCSGLISLVIPNSVTTLNQHAFSGCSSLVHVTVPASVTKLGMGVFSGCERLSSAGPISGEYDFEYGWTNTIPTNAFHSSRLTYITIPDSVTEIGSYAFAGCANLEKVTIPASVQKFGNSIYEPNGSNYSDYKLVTAGPIGGGYNIEFGWTYSIPTRAFDHCESLARVELPDGMAEIGTYAFNVCKSLNNVVLPNSVTNIDSNAFSDCHSLSNISLPNSVTRIGGSAFKGCINLESMTVPNSVTNLGLDVFYGCTNLEHVTLSNGLESIQGTFAKCENLTSIFIPSSITRFGYMAFYGCKRLTDIYYSGTLEQWNRIYDGSGDEEVLNHVTVHYNSIVDESAFIGNWEIDDEKTMSANGVSMIYLFGTDYSQNGCEMKINSDHTFKYGIGSGIGGEGEWSFDGSQIIYEITTYEEDAYESGGLQIDELGENKYFLVMPYFSYYQIYWKGVNSGTDSDEEDTPSDDKSTSLDRDMDEEIISKVAEYTSNEIYAQWNAILDSDFDNEEKLKRLDELFHNNGLTNLEEGIQYVSKVDAHRRDYLYLITDENYCAFNWWYWLYTTTKGKIARGLLYADGLIFNFELTDYIDWTTYVNGSYPGVEKCKTMLKDFMETDDNETLASEVAGNSKRIVKSMKNAIKLNDIVADAEMDEIMNNVINAQTSEQLAKYQKQFADLLIEQTRIQQKIEVGGEVKLYLGAESISKALGYTAPIINFAANTTDDIVELMTLENDIEKYEEYDEFLTTIYSERNVSKEMRIAAYQLHDDIENGYINKVRSILSNFISFETNMIYLDKSLLTTYLESHGLSTITKNLLGEALGTLTFATVISNIIIDTGDFVKQAAYTMSYAELSTLYSLKLQDDREAFRRNSSAENAWQFYEDYNLLWRLRYKGEEQYLKMNTVKAFIFGKIKTYGYTYKEEIVNDTLDMLKKCKFELADNITVPESVQYIKKAVIECPVDVLVYTKEGALVAELKDGIISDTVNKYGRFAVVYESYSGEYAKVICQSSDTDLDIQINSNGIGLVDYKSAQMGIADVLRFGVIVEAGDIIKVTDDYYQMIHNNGVEDEPKQLDILNDNYIKPKSISMNEASLELFVGEEKTLNISVLPNNATNKSVSWYSEDEEIAKVKNGCVIAESIGETVIWIKACDNEEVDNFIAVKVVNEKETLSPLTKSGIHIVGLKESYEYTGSKIIPNIGVMDYDADGGKLLVLGVDYTVKYKNNTKVGTAEITVTGKGNYSGKDVSARFTIKETENAKVPLASLKGAKFTILEPKLSYDGDAKYPDFKFALKGGEQLSNINMIKKEVFIQQMEIPFRLM